MQKDGPAGRDANLPPVPAALQTVLSLIGRGEATSRAAIARDTGLARSTVSQQVDALLARGIIEEVETSESVRGRPPRRLLISPNAGVIAVADVDVTATQIAIADLSGKVFARAVVPASVDQGPVKHLDAVIAEIRRLLETRERKLALVRHVVIGLPAPVDFRRGTVVRPPLMPGWDGFAVRRHVAEAFDCTVTVENDVNLMALGVATQEQTETPLLFVKVATGIGAGYVTEERTLLRGADGAAGDIGHIQVSTQRNAVCRCGKVDCLEAVASYRAVLGDLGIEGSPADDPLHASRDLARLVADSDAQALYRIRQAASDIGEVVATLIHALNPRTLVLGGPLSELHDEILSGVRASVYERALPLATRKLAITTSELGAEAGVVGAIALVTQDMFTADGVARLLARHPG